MTKLTTAEREALAHVVRRGLRAHRVDKATWDTACVGRCGKNCPYRQAKAALKKLEVAPA